MKYGMIKEALTLAKVSKPSQHETLVEVQKTMGKTLYETEALLAEGFSKQITPEDYDEWIRQVVLQAEEIRQDKGTALRLNKRSVFNDLLGDVLENDPMGKVNMGDEQLTKHVFDATWKRYQGTRDHLKATNVMKAREEEEALYRSADVGAERLAYQDEELNVNVPPQPEETDEFRPSDGSERYDDEDMSFDGQRGDGDVEGEMSGVADDEMGDEHIERETEEAMSTVENPFDEGTPEGDAWVAGFEAAIRAHEEGETPEEERAEHEGDDLEQEVPSEDGDTPFDLETMDAEQVDGDVEQTDGVDYEAGEVDRMPPEENEEKSIMRRSDAPWLERNIGAMKQRREKTLQQNPQANFSFMDSILAKHHKALKNAQSSTEDEERARIDWADRGYKAARAEYHQGRKPSAPTSSMERRQWERGYESFIKDTEGQRDLARKGIEDEEGSMVKSIISKPKDTINQALKGVEDEGATAFDKIKMPDNPHPTKSLAQRAWSKGFKNAVRDAFGFNEKPDMPKARKRRK